jgi:hypothetical protein
LYKTKWRTGSFVSALAIALRQDKDALMHTIDGRSEQLFRLAGIMALVLAGTAIILYAEDNANHDFWASPEPRSLRNYFFFCLSRVVCYYLFLSWDKFQVFVLVVFYILLVLGNQRVCWLY